MVTTYVTYTDSTGTHVIKDDGNYLFSIHLEEATIRPIARASNNVADLAAMNLPTSQQSEVDAAEALLLGGTTVWLDVLDQRIVLQGDGYGY